MLKKETKKADEKNDAYTKNFWIFIVLIIICAILAGVFGQVISRNYLQKDGYISSYSNEINLSNLNAGSDQLIIRDAKKVVVNQDVKMAETISGIRSAMIGIHKKENSNYYNLDNPSFVALIITSDGWIVAPMDKNSKAAFKPEEYVAIDNGRKSYVIDSVSSANNDGLLFLHLSGVQNLPVKKNAAKADFSLGQDMVIVRGFNSVEPATLVSLKGLSDISSSESPNLNLGLNVAGEEEKNTFVFNLAGDLAAIINSDGRVVPAFSYNYYWRSFLGNNDSGRAYLGVNYLDLSSVQMIASSSNASEITKGALLFSDDGKPAVLKSSPAEKAGFKEGDIITWVDNQELNSSIGLAEAISSYLPGDKVAITFLRGTVEKEMNIVLGELK